MLKQISEDVVFRLIRWRILDVQRQELYTYGMEVILLNGGVLLSTLVISLLTDTLLHFIFFIVIFCPLRIMAGGFHAKTSGRCFLLSNGIYILSIVIRYMLQNKGLEVFWLLSGILFIAVIFLTGPLERKGVDVAEHTHSRHKKKLNRLLLFALIFISVLYVLNIHYLDSAALGITFACLLQKRK